MPSESTAALRSLQRRYANSPSQLRARLASAEIAPGVVTTTRSSGAGGSADGPLWATIKRSAVAPGTQLPTLVTEDVVRQVCGTPAGLLSGPSPTLPAARHTRRADYQQASAPLWQADGYGASDAHGRLTTTRQLMERGVPSSEQAEATTRRAAKHATLQASHHAWAVAVETRVEREAAVASSLSDKRVASKRAQRARYHAAVLGGGGGWETGL